VVGADPREHVRPRLRQAEVGGQPERGRLRPVGQVVERDDEGRLGRRCEQVAEPQRRALGRVHAVAPRERRRHLPGFTHHDHGGTDRHHRPPERVEQAEARLLAPGATRRPAGEVAGDDLGGPLAERVERRVERPVPGEERRLVPRTAQVGEQLVVELLDPPVLPVARGVVRARPHERALVTEAHAEQVHDAGEQRRARAVHPGDADQLVERMVRRAHASYPESSNIFLPASERAKLMKPVATSLPSIGMAL